MKKICTSLALLILMNVAFLSCKKGDNDNSITSSFYFTADIDGQKVVFEDKKNGYGSGAGYSSGTVPTGCQIEQSLNITRGLIANASAGVLIVKTFSSCAVLCNQLEGMFIVGNYSYGRASRASNENGMNGVVIYYVDNNGVEWFSDKGVATQKNSSFKIVEHIANNDGYSAYITKAVFNCTLYDGIGNFKMLTNGEIRSRSVTCGF
jgi:hypothetical protein